MPIVYKIEAGTEGVLLTNVNQTVTTQGFETRNGLFFNEENLKISPQMITRKSYDTRSLAFQLAKKGYMIFVDTGDPEKYALAVKANDVEQMITASKWQIT
jgi:hypothetical protein